MAMTQMNTRMDDALKREGDAVFAQVGLSPSEVVRAVWEYAARHAEVPAIVAQALSESAEVAPSLETEYKVALAEASANIVAAFRERIGAPAPDKLEDIDYKAMREEAWMEKLQERGLA